jgi:hypothetical protein
MHKLDRRTFLKSSLLSTASFSLGNPEANQLLTREYRAPFVVPAV